MNGIKKFMYFYLIFKFVSLDIMLSLRIKIINKLILGGKGKK